MRRKFSCLFESIGWALALSTGLMSCAGHPQAGSDPEPSRGESAPCDDCAMEGDLKLTVVDSFIHVEHIPGFHLDSLAEPIGELPFLHIESSMLSKCKYCETFSNDGLEFDFGSQIDSLLSAQVPNRHFSILMPGSGIPDRDSSRFALELDSLARETFVDGCALMDFHPWRGRVNGVDTVLRNPSKALRMRVSRLAAQGGVKSMVIPIRLEVAMDPDAGHKGGYRYVVLWSIWNGVNGQLLWLVASDLAIETRGSLPPDRNWAEPFIQLLGQRLTGNPRP